MKYVVFRHKWLPLHRVPWHKDTCVEIASRGERAKRALGLQLIPRYSTRKPDVPYCDMSLIKYLSVLPALYQDLVGRGLTASTAGRGRRCRRPAWSGTRVAWRPRPGPRITLAWNWRAAPSPLARSGWQACSTVD